ncbi:MAG: thioredoxin domain-containing protein [Patescibacteria group bacterium]|jgi:protein-disulfide isomerase
MKNNKKYLILGVIVVIILAAALILRITKYKVAAPAEPTENLNIKEAQAQSYAASKTPILNNDDRFFGSKDAPLKIFVYEDYTDIYSAELADTLEKIRQENNRVAVIVRPYILENSPLSKTAALALECAADAGKWKEMRALLFANVKNNQLAAENFLAYARQLNLNENEFSACLTNSQKSERIDQEQAAAKGYSVLGAPTMFISDELILGARPYEDYVDSNGDKIEGLKKIVEGKLKD